MQNIQSFEQKVANRLLKKDKKKEIYREGKNQMAVHNLSTGGQGLISSMVYITSLWAVHVQTHT